MHFSHKKLYYAAFTLLFLAVTQCANAQLRRYPATNEGPQQLTKTQNATGRTKQTPPLTLPFFDDFSKPLGSTSYADTMLWESSYSVRVNDGMAIHPPTINVATFDGLDSAGMAYNPNEILLTGYTDQLVSRPIDLSENELAVEDRSGVYLSFFYQGQGNVEAPDQEDFLEIGFKTAEENGWETVMTIFPKTEDDATAFYDTIIQVTGDQYFHDAFQFRIRSYGRLSGPYDTWHVDYIYLNKGRNINDLSFPDRALSTQLGPLFGQYRAIPRDHFFSNEQMTPPTFEIQNMKNVEASINFRTDGSFHHTDRASGSTITHEAVISKATPINITDNVLFAYEHRAVRMDTLPDRNDPLQFPLDPAIDSTLIRLTIALQTRDNIPFNTTPPIEPDSTGDYTQNYAPIRFTTNDTLTADYVLADYFAYDDGVAEYAAGLIEAGNLVAYAFELDTTYAMKQDTLIGFDVYFPPYAITSNQTVDFFIYHDDPNNPGFPGEQWLRIPSRRVLRKGLNEFQRIEFLPALLIDEKRFYIGWQEPAVGEVMVGLDMSNDTGDKMFVNTNGTWYQNDEVHGSLMMRPVFGSGIIDASVGVEEEYQSALYPNPNHGTFYLEGDVRDLQIFSLTGESMTYETSALSNRIEVRANVRAPGLYLVRYREGKIMRSRKVVIRR
ncbi:MAG TPA: T9SS type A sorting domain-containing protein [Chryseosolibacter sp.]|nr:T9SS type A sorting domain-containing protein [Chryseosolibacter sp.]